MNITTSKRKSLELTATDIREKTVELIIHGNGGHIGGDLSETDILVNIYDLMKHDPCNPRWDGRDYFILSKGHSAEAYYCLLAHYGYITYEELMTFGTFGSKFGGHPTNKIPGVEASTGSLGHGLGLSVGMALSLKMDGKDNHVYVLTGDGELAEGSNWEAAMSAGKFKLDNLTWIIDRNGLQISGSTEYVMPLEDLAAKTRAFGFDTVIIDGHNYDAIREALVRRTVDKPVCIIAKTIKGKGLACAENHAEWHHKTPSAEQFKEFKHDLDQIRKGLQ